MVKLINNIRDKHKIIIKTKDSNNIIDKFICKRTIKKILISYYKLWDMITTKKETFTVDEILQLVKLINTGVKESKSADGIIDIKGDSLGFFNNEYSLRYQIFKDSNIIKYNFYNNNDIAISSTYNEIKNMVGMKKLKSENVKDNFAHVRIMSIIDSYIFDIISNNGRKNNEILNRLYIED